MIYKPYQKNPFILLLNRSSKCLAGRFKCHPGLYSGPRIPRTYQEKNRLKCQPRKERFLQLFSHLEPRKILKVFWFPFPGEKIVTDVAKIFRLGASSCLCNATRLTTERSRQEKAANVCTCTPSRFLATLSSPISSLFSTVTCLQIKQHPNYPMLPWCCVLNSLHSVLRFSNFQAEVGKGILHYFTT